MIEKLKAIDEYISSHPEMFDNHKDYLATSYAIASVRYRVQLSTPEGRVELLKKAVRL